MPKNEKSVIERKFFRFETKGIDLGKSEFTGYSAGIGNEDLGNDIIQPGAFTKTIKERVEAKAVKLLDNHNGDTTRNVWGTLVEAKEVPVEITGENAPSHKLLSRFDVSKADPDAQVALHKIEEGHLNQLSIGFRPIRVEYEKDEDSDFEDPRTAWLFGEGRRLIKEIQLWEVSMVIWAMNPEATIIGNSLQNLTEFAQKAANKGAPVSEDSVKQAVLALNRLIGKDVDDGQRAEIGRVLNEVSEAVDNVCTLAGKNVADPIQTLIGRFEGNALQDKEAFLSWVSTQITEEKEDELKIHNDGEELTIKGKDAGCGCGKSEKEEDDPSNNTVEDEEKTSEDVSEEKEVSEEDEVSTKSEEKDEVEEAEETKTESNAELISAIGELTEAFGSLKESLVSAETSQLEDVTVPDAEEVESEEKEESHTEDEEKTEAAKDTDDGRSEHFPDQEFVATELERLRMLALSDNIN